MTGKEPFKATMDKLLGDIRKVCHSMIDQNYISESPIKLVREALDYLDKQNIDTVKKNTSATKAEAKDNNTEHECCGGGCHQD